MKQSYLLYGMAMLVHLGAVAQQTGPQLNQTEISQPRSNHIDMRSPDRVVIGITGLITDESGAPLPGTSVTLKGTTAGTIADVNGKYSLDVPNGIGTLQFSFIGF